MYSLTFRIRRYASCALIANTRGAMLS